MTLSGEKKSSVVSASDKIIINAVKVENAIHKWCEKEFSDLARYEKYIQQN